MAEKLHGPIILSRIDKSLITTNAKGEKVCWVDMVPRKGGADQYGNTHSLQLYNKETRQTIYLGDFRPQEFGTAAAPQAAPASHDEAAHDNNDDFPF